MNCKTIKMLLAPALPLAMSLALAFSLSGCDTEPGPEEPANPRTGETAPDAVPDQIQVPQERTFAVRGWVRSIPMDQTDTPPIVNITHEEVPQLPMQAMTMPFIVEDGEALKSLEVGDKLKFTMVLGGQSRAVARDIEQLPADTQLDLPERLQPE